MIYVVYYIEAIWLIGLFKFTFYWLIRGHKLKDVWRALDGQGLLFTMEKKNG